MPALVCTPRVHLYLALFFCCTAFTLLFPYGSPSSLSFIQLTLTQVYINTHTHRIYLHLCSCPLTYECSTWLAHISLPQTIHWFPYHNPAKSSYLSFLPSQPFSYCPPASLFVSPCTVPHNFPSLQSILLPSPQLCPSVCLSLLPTVLSSWYTYTPVSLSPFPPATFHLFVSPTHPGPHLLSPTLRGGSSKEFAADRCIARRQTHGRPCAGQFLPECPKSHIPSIISSTGKTDGRINECSLIKGGKGACLGCSSPVQGHTSHMGTALSLLYQSSFVPERASWAGYKLFPSTRWKGEG